MFKNNRGFTLIEMLIVLTIIAVLILLVVPSLSGKSKEVNRKGCSALLAVVQAQADTYYLDKGSYPSSIDQLVSEKYITDEQRKCPNQETLAINKDGKVYLLSNGT